MLNVAVSYTSLILYHPGLLLKYFRNVDMVPVAPIITGITFVLHSTCAVCKVFVFYNLLGFFTDHISVPSSRNIYQRTCSFFIIKDYAVRFMVSDIIIIIIIITFLSSLCRVCIIMYMKQTMFPGYVVLQLFCTYNLCYM